MEEIDIQIFPDDPCEALAFLYQKPRDTSLDFGYVSNLPPSPIIGHEGGEAYLIFSYNIEERIAKEQAKKLILFDDEALKMETNYTFEEAILGIAAHEVRHRVQHHYDERRFHPYSDKDKIPPYFQRVLMYYQIEARIETSNVSQFRNEFDAQALEQIAVEYFHNRKMSIENGDDIQKIAQIVNSGPQEIFKMRV
ncbi:MAG: hypothetical protein GF370_00460 [Candidatus Nealsonbacteria bacterium]|nr:hypothetical protein [Candidatus Nealsonbacteria bacterium]